MNVAEETMIEETLADAEKRMGKAVEALRRDLATVRTGRASPGLVEQLRVDYYGTPTPLKQLASINVQEARLLTVQPWDKGSLGAIEQNPAQMRQSHRDAAKAQRRQTL